MTDRAVSACSGVIIADGRTQTADAGTPAAGLPHMFSMLRPIFDDLILVAGDPAAFLEYDALIASDHGAGGGLWSGVYAGLFSARNAHAFVVTPGFPGICAELIALFVDAIAPSRDAILPAGSGAPLTTSGLYSKSCLKPLGRQLAKGDAQGSSWLHRIRVHTLSPEALRKAAADGPAVQPGD